MNSSNDVAVKSLAKYLRTELNIPVREEWPDPKEKLDLPCITLFGINKPIMPTMPTIHSQTDNAENPDLLDLVYTIGQYDFTIQLDLWCEYKTQRGEWAEKIDAALNKEFIEGDQPTGLSLMLEDYAEVIARYDNVGYTYLDNEEAAHRSEWRVKFELLVNHSKVVLKTAPKMKEIILDQNVSEENFDDDNEESIEI